MDIVYNNPWLLPESTAKEYLQNYEQYMAQKDNTKNIIAETDEWKPRIMNETAVVPVVGLIMRYANNLNMLCGMPTSTGMLHNTINNYAKDDSIKQIVLEIDSPGGDARGISDLAQTIKAVSNIKPIIAVVTGTCASAAYWIASACNKIYASETSFIGSIGAIAAYRKDKDSEVEEFVSSQSPNKRLDLEKKDDRAIIQANIDDVANVFIESVAQNRSMTKEEVVQAGNKGAVLIAKKALNNKLIDAIGNMDSVLSFKENRMENNKTQAVEEKETATSLVEADANLKLAEMAAKLSEAEKHQASLIAKLEQQAAELQASQDALTKQMFVNKAEKEFPNLSGTVEEKGELLMALSSLSETHQETLLGYMRNAEQHIASMMTTVSAETSDITKDTYEDKINTRAAEIMAANAGMSKEKAKQLAYMEIGD